VSPRLQIGRPEKNRTSSAAEDWPYQKVLITHYTLSLIIALPSFEEFSYASNFNLVSLLVLGFAMPVTDVMAQSSAGSDAVGGAIIGSAVGGRRGAAVGAATGAVVETLRQRRPYRRPRKKAAISAANALGCSIAAKCPPFAIGVQR
jgi:hypothetical protein